MILHSCIHKKRCPLKIVNIISSTFYLWNNMIKACILSRDKFFIGIDTSILLIFQYLFNCFPVCSRPCIIIRRDFKPTCFTNQTDCCLFATTAQPFFLSLYMHSLNTLDPLGRTVTATSPVFGGFPTTCITKVVFLPMFSNHSGCFYSLYTACLTTNSFFYRKATINTQIVGFP